MCIFNMGIKQEKPAAPMADKICDSSCNCFVYRNIRTVTFERLTWSLLLLREFTILKIFLWLPVNHSSAICWPRDLYLWPFSCVSCRYLVAVTLPPSSSVMVHFVPGILTLYSANAIIVPYRITASWYTGLIGGLLHLVQRAGDWAGPQPAHVPPRCT